MNVFFFDLETTGTNTSKDRIVQMTGAMVDIASMGGDVDMRTHLFNPGIPIPEEATAVHGITDEMVADQPSFTARSKALVAWIGNAALCGYNVRGFDLPLLYRQLDESGITLEMEGRPVVDLMELYFRANPRSLSDCFRQYMNRELEGAHDASVDVQATIDLFSVLPQAHAGEEGLWPALGTDIDNARTDIENLSAFCDEGRPLRLTPWDKWFEGDPPRFRQGKHKGDLLTDQRGYCDWLMRKSDDAQDPRFVMQLEIALGQASQGSLL